MKLYLLSCLLVVCVLCGHSEALGDNDTDILNNISELWTFNGYPYFILQDGTVEVVAMSTTEFSPGIVYSATTTKKNSEGYFELEFDSSDCNGNMDQTKRLAEETDPGLIVLKDFSGETKRKLLYLFDWKEHGIAANYQWMPNGSGISKCGILKVNANGFNKDKICDAIKVFKTSGLELDQNRKFVIGREDNGKLKYLDVSCN